MAKKRIGFLFLDELHHVNHFISVAVELSKTCDVSILTFPGEHAYLRSTLKRLNGDAVKIVERRTLLFRQFTDTLKKRKLPRKGFWLKRNNNYLLSHFDALVLTDYFQKELLKARGNRSHPKLLKFPHGAPGRSYSYNSDQLSFDFQLLYGDFHYQQFKEKGLLGPHPVIIGYPKLDAVASLPIQKFFDNDRPTVLYNPHFSPPTSSWHGMGLEILEYFYSQNKFNLIFAPHINLFQHKGGESGASLPAKYFEAKHFYIDLGSEESVNMTYTRSADIFLGEVSSQVFEFTLNPRPCVFINQDKIEYENDDNFRFWKCGSVIENIQELDTALSAAFNDFEKYHPVQERMNRENFYTEVGTTASERAAKAVIDFLNQSVH